jgi:Methyltransferase domain
VRRESEGERRGIYFKVLIVGLLSVAYKLRRRALEDYSVAERRAMWPAAIELPQALLDNCRMITDRYKMLELIPKEGICAEVGIDQCDFSAKILETTDPLELHLIDISERSVSKARERFSTQMVSGKVKTHCGDSSTILKQLPISLDWIYIDGDHTYEGAKKDLEAAESKLKPGGLIALNDYVFFGVSDFCKYGVIEAVNEFRIDRRFEMIYFALQGRMYCDVVLRRETATR